MRKTSLLAILIVALLLLTPAHQAFPAEAKAITQTDLGAHHQEALAASEPATIKIANLSYQELSALGSAVNKVLHEEWKLGETRKVVLARTQELAGEAKDVGGLFKGFIGFFRKILANLGLIKVQPPENVVTLSIDTQIVLFALGHTATKLATLFFGPLGGGVTTVLTEVAKWAGKEWGIREGLQHIGYAEVKKPDVGIMTIIYDKKAKVAWVNVDLDDLKEEWKEEYGWENEHLYMYVPFDQKPPRLKKADGRFDYKVVFKAEAVQLVTPPPTPTTPSAEVRIDPTSGAVGTEVEITGVDFGSRDDITVEYDGEEIDIASGDRDTDSNGDFDNTLIIIPPSNAGDHVITVTDESDSEATAVFTVKEQITITPTKGAAGDIVTVKGTGFGEDVEVTIEFGGTEVASLETDNDGSFQVSFTVPVKSPGTYQIEAEDEDRNRDKADFTVNVSLPPSPVGKIAFVSDRGGDEEIFATDSAGTKQTNLTKNPANDRAPAWSPNGTTIAFVSDREPQGIYLMNADGTDQRFLTEGEDPSWFPDGSKIIYTKPVTYTKRSWLGTKKYSAKRLFIMKVDGTGIKEISPDRNTASVRDFDFVLKQHFARPEVSPDGSQIAFAIGKWESGWGYDIHLMSVAGANLHRLAETYYDYGGDDPSWHPNGQRIAYRADQGYGLDVVGFGGPLLTAMASDVPDNDPKEFYFKEGSKIWVYGGLDWAPDGHMIVFSGHADQNIGLYVLHVSEQILKRLPGKGNNYDPDWAPR